MMVNTRFKQRAARGMMAALVLSFLVLAVPAFAGPEEGQSADGKVQLTAAAQAEVTKFAFVAAALAFGLGAVGAGIAIGNVGAAALGAIGEKPELAGQALIFVALAEGLVVFGFIVALMILGKA